MTRVILEMKAALLFASALCAAAAGCGGSPVSPGQPAPSGSPFTATHTGTWLVTMMVDSCTGNRQCGHSLRKPTTFLVRLLEEAGAVTGAFATPGAMFAMPVQGTRAARELSLSGSTPAAFPGQYGSYAHTVALRGWLLKDPYGQIELTTTGVAMGDFFGHYVLKGTIVDAERTSAHASPETFTGTWRGSIVRRACSVKEWPSCFGSAETLYDLVLEQSGNRVTGSMAVGGPRIPVEGEVSGGTLTLRGGEEQTSGASRSVTELVSYTATRDSIGFLSGTFTYRQRYMPNDGRVYETLVEYELWNVLLRER